jgi:hypothetical protein
MADKKKYGKTLTDVTPGAVDVSALEKAFKSSWQKGIVPIFKYIKTKVNPTIKKSKESQILPGQQKEFKSGGKANYRNIYEQNN